MSEEHQLPSDSDEDDEDYVPDGADEAVSEAESEGDAESGPEDENNENEQLTTQKGKKRGRRCKKGSKRRKRCGVEEEILETEEKKEEAKVLTEEEEKQRADSLWADFMKDTGTIARPKPQNSTNGGATTPPIRPKPEEKVKITKVFEFAGEEVKIEKEVSATSAEARLSLLSSEKPRPTPEAAPRPSGRGGGAKKGGLGGISSVLGQIGKKTKISTLEKSKLDWDNFKKQENLDEEITTHNKGRDGFLERQDFLQRADMRQFEIEKQLRTTARRSNR
ncbi:craniofacial development protein 1 [Diachasma alloeum]|uniref:craniofacial development protein 1 n=1 Tax=Diachasma alloeum TaxID=454923 RepID=UPI0007381B2B|nr:craniofacial development protein 1 [Diachasma alloeum]XP_015127611.1 craniofacial development protein 1 [Diachasma alloeum]